MKCRFYDDGAGNGSYISGSHVGPPSCTISGDYSIPKCNGNTKKCNINESRVAHLKNHIEQIKKEI